MFTTRRKQKVRSTTKGWKGTVGHVEWDLAAHMENLMAWSILLLRTYNGDDLSARGGNVKERERGERINMSVKF
jgi:hypothetical protein